MKRSSRKAKRAQRKLNHRERRHTQYVAERRSRRRAGRDDATKRILVWSDVQVGHVLSIAPKSKWKAIAAQTSDPRIRAEWMSFQRLLRREFLKMIRTVRPTHLFLPGENIDGKNKKEDGRGEWTTDTNVQADACEELVKEIVEYCRSEGIVLKIFGVPGSRYHEEEAKVLRDLHATYDKTLKIRVDGVHFHLAHQIGVSRNGIAGRAAALGRAMDAAINNKDYFGNIKWIIFGHAQYKIVIHSDKIDGLIAPAFQGRTEFQKDQGMGLVPSLGYVWFEVRGKKCVYHDHEIPLPKMTEVRG